MPHAKPKPKTKAKPREKTKAQGGRRPIELYYWPTPNGWKISIMLEECGLPYNMIPVNIAPRRPVQAGIPDDLAQQPHAGDRRSGRAGRRADLGLRVRRHPAISRAQDRKVLSGRRARARRGRPVAVLADGRPRPDGGAGASLPASMRRRSSRTPSTATPTRCNRLYGVMNKRLKDRAFLAGDYSIADMACIGWASRHGSGRGRTSASFRISSAGSRR